MCSETVFLLTDRLAFDWRFLDWRDVREHSTVQYTNDILYIFVASPLRYASHSKDG